MDLIVEHACYSDSKTALSRGENLEEEGSASHIHTYRQRIKKRGKIHLASVHFYPLKQFQHCFKIVLSSPGGVIVLCMRPPAKQRRLIIYTMCSSSKEEHLIRSLLAQRVLLLFFIPPTSPFPDFYSFFFARKLPPAFGGYVCLISHSLERGDRKRVSRICFKTIDSVLGAIGKIYLKSPFQK